MRQIGRNDPCPCGSGQKFKKCCDLFITGAALPETPEQLMRSRFTAYVTGNAAYVYDTTHPENEAIKETSREQFLLETKEYCRRVEFTGLTVHEATGPDEQGVAHVKFTARYQAAGKEDSFSEDSTFVRLNGRWVYRDGVMSE